MKLTNEIRQAVAIGLVVHAARKNVTAMNKAEAALKTLWFDAVRKEALSFYPELSQPRVTELLQQRCLVHYSADPQYPNLVVSGSERWGDNKNDYCSKDTSPLLKALKQKFNFPLFTARVYYGRIEFFSRHPDNCPRIPEQREAFAKQYIKYCEKIRALAMRHVAIWEQSMTLYFELRGILDSITTVEKMKELMPETEAHIPPTKAKSNGIVPLETIQRARAIMETGIPD